MRRALPGGALAAADLNGSLDASALSFGGGVDTTARLDARKSLSSSGLGRASFLAKAPAPGTAKKPAFGVGPRASMAAKENGGDRCVGAARGLRARASARQTAAPISP